MVNVRLEAHSGEVDNRSKLLLKKRLIELVESGSSVSKGKALPDYNQLKVRLRQSLKDFPEDGISLLPEAQQEKLIDEIIRDTVGFGPLDSLLSDPKVNEIMVNGPDEIFVERNGVVERLQEKFQDTHHLMSVIERMLDAIGGVAVNESSPICDATLPDGSRLNIIIPPLVLNGPTVTIRRKLPDWTSDAYRNTGALTEEATEFLLSCVHAKVNMIISGGTSTGKTTLVSVLSASIPRNERVVTIENVAELDLLNRDHWVRLVGRPPNIQGRGEVTLRALVSNALRMRPDRIILGEARGGEALDVVQAMHSGHDGVITVLHANSPIAALDRLQTLMLMSGLDVPPEACRAQIASAVDIVVHMGRFMDGSRRVTSISQIAGIENDAFQLEEIFKFQVEGYTEDGKLKGGLSYMGIRPNSLQKFNLYNVQIPGWLK